MKVFLRRVALYAFALWSFFPLYWLLNTSFKTSKDALARPPTFIFKPIMKNYTEVIKNNEVWGYFLDSLIVASVKFSFRLSIGCPKKFEPSKAIRNWVLKNNRKIFIYNDPKKAVLEADVVFSDKVISLSPCNSERKTASPSGVADQIRERTPKTSVQATCQVHLGSESPLPLTVQSTVVNANFS